MVLRVRDIFVRVRYVCLYSRIYIYIHIYHPCAIRKHRTLVCVMNIMDTIPQIVKIDGIVMFVHPKGFERNPNIVERCVFSRQRMHIVVTIQQTVNTDIRVKCAMRANKNMNSLPSEITFTCPAPGSCEQSTHTAMRTTMRRSYS